jgi:hypothetical protein
VGERGGKFVKSLLLIDVVIFWLSFLGAKELVDVFETVMMLLLPTNCSFSDSKSTISCEISNE